MTEALISGDQSNVIFENWVTEMLTGFLNTHAVLINESI